VIIAYVVNESMPLTNFSIYTILRYVIFAAVIVRYVCLRAVVGRGDEDELEILRNGDDGYNICQVNEPFIISKLFLIVPKPYLQELL
jgi:hypothetical protein